MPDAFRAALGGTMAGALVVGCQPLPDVRYETDHAEIATFFDAPLCAGNLAHVDEWILKLVAVLEAPVDEKIRIYWGAEGVDAHCVVDGIHGGGCHRFGGGPTFVQAATLNHELVHAVGDRIGPMEIFFEEGIAHALDGALMGMEDFQTLPNELIGLSPRDFEQKNGRPIASHFVRFLIDEQGMGPLNRLRGRVRRDSTRTEVTDAFGGIYAQPLADFETAWVAQAPFSYDVTHQDPQAIDHWQNEYLEIRRNLACDDVSTHGPLSGVGILEDLHEQEGMYTTATFDIVVTGTYDVSLAGERGSAHLQSGACWDSTPTGTSVVELESGMSTETQMRACRWVATLWVEGTNDTELILTLRRTGDPP